MQRRILMAVVAGALVLGACSSDSDETSDATAAPTSAAATTAAATTAAGTTASAETTAGLPSTGGGDADLSVTPIALCTDGGTTYFAYENSSAEPVVIPAGSDNSVEDGDPEDDPLGPTVFAPGRVSPAFATDSTATTWTVTGPDGVTTTADGATAPECTDELLTPTVKDDRAAVLAVGWSDPRAFDEQSGTPPAIEVTATVAGLPNVSVCPPGLEPQEPRVAFAKRATLGAIAKDTTASGEGTSVRTTLTFQPSTNPSTGVTTLVAPALFGAFIVDRCAGGGEVNTSWPTGDLGWGLVSAFCFRVNDAKAFPEVTVEQIDGLYECLPDGQQPDLPPTGGVRIRSAPTSG